jgi:glyoxylase-like metal-dependent hydrolase (beta-lactamase superfamily II)
MNTRNERLIPRRQLLVRTGQAGLGVAVFGFAAACSNPDGGTPSASRSAAPQSSPPDATPDATVSGDTAGPVASELRWSRVDLGFVAAYVLVRGREAAVVDTGVGGSADAIGAVLDKAGPGWAGVRHVILTHKHGDHAGSIGDVLDNAPRATGYAGADDLADVSAPRRLRALRDDDDVFGLRIIATPGHTRGHVAVYDGGTGVMVAGDALNNMDGLAGSNPQFTDDSTAAKDSVRKLALLRPDTILVGHGAPVEKDAAEMLQRLAGSL